MYLFSPITLTCLYAGGWTEEYRFDPSAYRRILQHKGFTVFPVVEEFLGRFGGLRIVRPSWHLPGATVWFDFQVESTSERKENFADDEADMQTSLCPIGDAYEHKMPMLMDIAGNVYFSFEGAHRLGASGEDAIEALCTNRLIEGYHLEHL